MDGFLVHPVIPGTYTLPSGRIIREIQINVLIGLSCVSTKLVFVSRIDYNRIVAHNASIVKGRHFHVCPPPSLRLPF